MSRYYGDFRINDCHVHASGGEGLDAFVRHANDFIENVQMDSINILCINGAKPGGGVGVDLLSLALKSKDPRFTVYGGFGYWMNTIACDAAGLKTQLETMMAAGFDGLKMIEGKPTFRAASGIPLDDARYDPAYELLESSGFHVLNHVNDPEEFWDKDNCPEWAGDVGGGYWKADKFLSKEQHYAENANIMARHPNVNVTFAHAHFFSNFPDRMVALLEKYPMATVDLTPGIEMYDGFTKQRDRWREIFVAYQDRFLFGTDNTTPMSKGMTHDGSGRYKVEKMVRFLTTSDEFEGWGYNLKGLGLPAGAAEKIMYTNYPRLRGPAKPVNADAAVAYGEAVLREVKDRNDVPEANKNDIKEASAYFKSL
jgi:hypothetical protein